MDTRIEVIDKRLKNIRKIIAISGGKGGIGKSSVSATLAASLAKKGHKVGLLDLDFSGPSTHIILGIRNYDFPKEDKGIIPSKYFGIKFMSIISFAGENPAPLRGIDISNAIIELLAITQWGSLDFLIIDMPPGIGDTTLDIIRTMKRVKFIMISTPSKLAFEIVKKSINLLLELKMPIIGIIENMKFSENSSIKIQVEKYQLPFLGEIYFDKNLENAIGNIDKLYKTEFAEDLEKIIPKIFD
ncbi:MAG: P-loop NTPase [Candidatus Cloacimonetes bacterium]|nr:P-loop NTPase [Candidatus Cloacimonadota bacterium]